MWYSSLRCNTKESRFLYFSYVSFLLKYISFLTFPLNYSLFVSCVLFFWCFTIFSLFQLVLTRMCVCSSFSIFHEILLTAIVCEFFFVLSKCTTFPGLKIARLFLFYFFYLCRVTEPRAHTHIPKFYFFLHNPTLLLCLSYFSFEDCFILRFV